MAVHIQVAHVSGPTTSIHWIYIYTRMGNQPTNYTHTHVQTYRCIFWPALSGICCINGTFTK